MFTHYQVKILAIMAATLYCGLAYAAPAGTGFSYQGSLTDDGQPANGPHDFFFRLYGSENAVIGIGGPVAFEDVEVIDSLFTLWLDFGDQFNGNERWLGIWVRPGESSGAHTPLSPRQELTPVPYALSAAQLSLPLSQFGQTDDAVLETGLLQITQSGTANAILASATGGGAALRAQASGTSAGVEAESTGAGAAIHARSTTGGTALELENGALRVSGQNRSAFSAMVWLDSFQLVIDHPLTNGDSSAILIVTPKMGATFAGDPVSPAPAFVDFEDSLQKWVIKPFPGQSLNTFSIYNVLVIKTQ